MLFRSRIVPVKWIDEVLDLALERPLPGRGVPGEGTQPPLSKPGERTSSDVKH